MAFNIVHASEGLVYVKFVLKYATMYTNITGLTLQGVWLWNEFLTYILKSFWEELSFDLLGTSHKKSSEIWVSNSKSCENKLSNCRQSL